MIPKEKERVYMLRFCDSEVYIMYEETITRSGLFTFFCRAGQSSSIIVVLNSEDVFQGIITYDLLLERNAGDDLIQRECVELNDEIWVNAKRLFENNKEMIYLPVFNSQNELIYFCYNVSGNSNEQYIDYMLDSLERSQEYLFIREIYPRVQVVCIHDFNEWAYRLYYILKARGIPVVTVGAKWKEWGLETAELFEYPDYSVMNIYAEGTALVDTERDRTQKNRFRPCLGFNFLVSIARTNARYVEMLMKEKASERLFRCSIPIFSQLTDYSLSEFHRYSVKFGLKGRGMKIPEHFKDGYAMKLYGMNYRDSEDKLLEEEREVKNNLSVLELGQTSIIGKRYGTGKIRIYLVGPCIVNGIEALEQNQLAYSLFSLVEQRYPEKFSIFTVPIGTNYFRERELAIEQLLKGIDNLIIIIEQSQDYKLLESILPAMQPDFDLLDLFNERPLDKDWFVDIPIHTTGTGNRIIAEEIFTKFLEPVVQSMDFSEDEGELQREALQLTRKEIAELKTYLNMIKKQCFDVQEGDKVGAIVMNCNPFTNGHLYLIEEARKQVDYLYIFLVEEDRSFFPFADRIELIRKGTSSFGNVKVFPSGLFILSYNTLPSYFNKDDVQDITIDASTDIRIFAELIAPALRIQVRFVGEEPLDNITNQYNREMERTLGKYDIEFVEIPRKTSAEEVISASRVRRWLKDNSFEEIKKIVPESTYNYLITRYGGSYTEPGIKI